MYSPVLFFQNKQRFEGIPLLQLKYVSVRIITGISKINPGECFLLVLKCYLSSVPYIFGSTKPSLSTANFYILCPDLVKRI